MNTGLYTVDKGLPTAGKGRESNGCWEVTQVTKDKGQRTKDTQHSAKWIWLKKPSAI